MNKKKIAINTAGTATGLLALLGLIFCCCCSTCHSGRSGAHFAFWCQLCWNILGVGLFVLAAKIKWSWWMKAALFVLGGWVAMFVAAHFCPSVNGSLYLGDGPIRIEVMSCLPFVAALFLAWYAKDSRWRTLTLTAMVLVTGCTASVVLGKWFLSVVVLLWGVLTGVFAYCWRFSDDHPKRVFVLFGGLGLLLPAALCVCECFSLTPMRYTCVPLVAFSGTKVLMAWLTLGTMASLVGDERRVVESVVQPSVDADSTMRNA